ncbi:dihydroorotase, multifunctional complex type [Thalassoporum mexicanum PCC 7367]|uniref:dihydroorotase n=1 Tax=Thalassoporum mexicanum TaxID=3457544 RepID=UPI00029FC793|nr:dihydroorotase [Pseudanabaena sp. PCC 7367]AFY71174.1 dihydroorotase, multifunctional complex type [Pseudanabaena sp. PCC 7367]
MSILIKQAQILLPDGNLQTGDLLVRQGKIAAIAENIDETADQTIEAEGLTLLPGVIDPQVHFREPGLEYKEDLRTASHACAKGGVTSFLEMPNTKPLTVTQAAMDHKLGLAASKCVVNYGFFTGATSHNLEELLSVNPTCGIKIFMGSMKGDLLVSEEEVLDKIFGHGSRLIAVHAEDQERIKQRRQEILSQYGDPPTDVPNAVHSEIQDNQAALLATKLAVKLSTRYQRRLHILHLSTGEEVEYLREHKAPWITAEVTPQHLMLNTTAYEKLGSLAQMNPPLRSPEHNQMLWQGLHDGILDFIATDHAPHTLEEKARPYPGCPSGMPGVETSLPLMLTAAADGRCTLAQVSRWMSINAAKAYKIPNKGELRIGWDADLVLVDRQTRKPVRREELLTKCGWSPFEGWQLTGWPVVTIVGGEVVFADGKVNAQVRGKALSFNA